MPQPQHRRAPVRTAQEHTGPALVASSPPPRSSAVIGPLLAPAIFTPFGLFEPHAAAPVVIVVLLPATVALSTARVWDTPHLLSGAGPTCALADLLFLISRL